MRGAEMMGRRGWNVVLFGLLVLLPGVASAQPALDLPPGSDGTSGGGDGATSDSESSGVDPLRGLQQDRMDRAVSTVVGGYSELHLNIAIPEEGTAEGQIDLHRLVIFLAHGFSSTIRFYSEIEVEHAFAGDGAPGEVGVEQAFVEWDLLGDHLGLRAGIVLVPMGIINQWHEPPIFNGVERPSVDKRIIPSTWREGAIGLYGHPLDILSFEVYVMSGLDPLGFSGGSGIRGGRQHVAKAVFDSPAWAGRIELEPILGLALGLAGYFGDAGPNARDVYATASNGGTELVDLEVPVAGGAFDVRYRGNGLHARALAAWFSVGGTDDLRRLTDEEGTDIAVDMGSQLFGAYVELGYDVLHPLGFEAELIPFFRYELADTAFDADTASGVGERSVTDIVFGLTYLPVPSVAFKFDTILRSPVEGDSETIVDLGVGAMF